MIVKNLFCYSESELSEKLEQLKKENYNPTIAMIFADPKFDYVKISKILMDENIDCLGASSAGEIYNGETLENSITVMLMDLSKEKYRYVLKEVDENKSYQTGLEVADISKAAFNNPSFITCFCANVHGENIIEGINEVCGTDVTIFGGMASNVTKENEPFLFTEGKVYKNAIAFIIIDGDAVELNGFAIHGWEPIGGEHTITKASFNQIYEIDGEPALDFFERFFGFFKDPVAKDDVNTVNSQYPMQVFRNGEMIMRAPLNSNKEEKSLMMAGPIKEGEKFKFSIAPGFEVIDKAIEKFNEFKQTIDKPDAMVLFSCKARHWSFGPMIEKENEALQELWEIPFTGFFTFGEVGRNDNNPVNFYNETCCLLTLKEVE